MQQKPALSEPPAPRKILFHAGIVQTGSSPILGSIHGTCIYRLAVAPRLDSVGRIDIPAPALTLGEGPQLRYVRVVRWLTLKAALANALTTFERENGFKPAFNPHQAGQIWSAASSSERRSIGI
jgi:hypothetical protein